jgi:hypothetical protein
MFMLLRMVGVMLIGFAAMAIVAWGWGWWLAWAMYVGEEYGPNWRIVALVSMAALNVAAGWGLFRLQDRLARKMDFRMGPRAPRDRLFCQRCGAAAEASAAACSVCGAARFGLRPPAAPAPTAYTAPASPVRST